MLISRDRRGVKYAEVVGEAVLFGVWFFDAGGDVEDEVKEFFTLFCDGAVADGSRACVEVFMTGRGTPYGLAAAPVIKLCSRNEMKEQWPDIIDFNAGPAAVGDRTIAEQGAFDIRRGVPAVLNSDIAAGRLDISNVSSILYARHAEKLCVLPHVCVSSDGPVESILLVSKKPIEELEDDPIALTAKSATSHALLKIILRSGYGANPRYTVQNLYRVTSAVAQVIYLNDLFLASDTAS